MTMKYINSLLMAVSLLFAGVAFSSCGEDEPSSTTPGVYVPAGGSTDIEINPWGSVVANALVFNSTGDWAADIYAANSSFEILEGQSGNDVDWLEVVPFKGGAGEVTATLYATPNNSSESRYAVVVINSPVNSISFRVTQLGRSGSGGGDTPAPNPGGE